MATPAIPQRPIPNSIKFLFGGLAGMGATVFVQPLDLIKTRMQLSGGGRSSFSVGSEILRKEGVSGIYTGLSAGLLRQATYTTTRLGIYTWLFDLIKSPEGAPPGFGTKMGLGVVAGGVGAFVGTPAEVSLIRMTADGRLPLEQRRNYKNVADALLRIIREEGLFSLWRGTTPTIGRAMVVNAAQLSSYSQAREMLNVYIPDGIGLHFVASMISGLITTVASMPVDIIKTRIQNAEGSLSMKKVVVDIVKNEGVFSLWKGFLPYYARLGPHTILTFIFLEQMNAWYKRQ
ncbi:mitochondrial 2-oxoglutarate/malate carrier protein [Arctopsyche grandis]|uniref:mitochondrial 2-oxoglutarate/malate carrier protein n=1 Tax=Arctopsyche grandis TaxID=121162 RepID=UPI00406D78E3